MIDLRQAVQQAIEALDSDNPDIQLRAAVTLRAALAQPLQEPLAWLYPEGLKALQNGKCWTAYPTQHEDCKIPLYTTPPQQQAEPVAWDKPSDNFNEWWDSDRHDNGNPFTTDSFAYWAWEGWQAALAQRQWVGLTDEDMNDPRTQNFDFIYGARWAETKLKERNG